jgi:hypothetical protein
MKLNIHNLSTKSILQEQKITIPAPASFLLTAERFIFHWGRRFGIFMLEIKIGIWTKVSMTGFLKII